MRITAGNFKGRKLEAPKNNSVRPTSDKVRQAVFNALNARGDVENAIVIDAFCGTGALGLEALSRGAAQCYFFDKNKDPYNLCKQNINTLGAEGQSELVLQDVTKIKERSEEALPATLVFLDPPYKKDLVIAAIDALHSQSWFAEKVTFVIETEKNETVSSDKVKIENEKNYGDTKITFASLL